MRNLMKEAAAWKANEIQKLVDSGFVSVVLDYWDEHCYGELEYYVLPKHAKKFQRGKLIDVESFHIPDGEVVLVEDWEGR